MPASPTVSSPEEGELTPDTEATDRIASQVQRAMNLSEATVSEKEARYFMLSQTVCNQCGLKGHLSFDCPEAVAPKNCFLCGRPGHTSLACPAEVCFHCQKPGHIAKDCKEREKGARRIERRRRNVSPPRSFQMHCYVCGGVGHLDCSLGKFKALLSCYNCGNAGHAGHNCPFSPVERVMPAVLELERERRIRDKKAIGGAKKKRKRPESDKEKAKELETSDDGEVDLVLVARMKAAEDFHRRVMEVARRRSSYRNR